MTKLISKCRVSDVEPIQSSYGAASSSLSRRSSSRSRNLLLQGVPQGGITTTTTTTKTQVYEYNSDGVVRQGGMDQGPVPENFVSPRVSQAEYLQQPQTIHTSQTITHGGGVVHTNVPGPLPPLPVQVTGHQMGGAPPPRVVLVPGQAPPPPVVHLPPGSGIVTGNMPPQPGAPTGAPMPPLVVTPAPAVHSG